MVESDEVRQDLALSSVRASCMKCLCDWCKSCVTEGAQSKAMSRVGDVVVSPRKGKVQSLGERKEASGCSES